MNRTPRLSKSGIEYLDYVWNFYSGCLNWKNGVCSVGENCWAKGTTERFKQFYPNGFEPAFYSEAFHSPLYLKKPSIIGVCFMGDLFGSWNKPKQLVETSWVLDGRPYTSRKPLREAVFQTIEACPRHRFLFLTKCPWNLAKWSPFPDNCWVGASATNKPSYNRAIEEITKVEASVKFLSLEPLLGDVRWCEPDGLAEDFKDAGIKWVIIGAQTRPYKPPKIEWVEEIVRACDKAGVPVFLKDNLESLLKGAEGWAPAWAVSARECDGTEYLRQEVPG